MMKNQDPDGKQVEMGIRNSVDLSLGFESRQHGFWRWRIFAIESSTRRWQIVYSKHVIFSCLEAMENAKCIEIVYAENQDSLPNYLKETHRFASFLIQAADYQLVREMLED